MKYLFFLVVLFNIMALQPYDKKYVQCSMSGYYYKKGKLIKVAELGDNTILYGDGISASRFFIDHKRVITDSIVFKIK